MPCHLCRPAFIAFKRKWSLKAFRELRTKYTEQHIDLGQAYERIRELEDELIQLQNEIAFLQGEQE